MALTNRGIVMTSDSKARITLLPIPKIPDGFLLVKTAAVSIQPTDTWEEVFVAGLSEVVWGTDGAGTGVEVGQNVTKLFKKGGRIACLSHGGNVLYPEYGTFGECVLVNSNIAIHIPSQMSFENAATLPTGIITLALGLYRHLGLPKLSFPFQERPGNGKSISIYGGSFASGTMATQFAKLSGVTVITTSSPRNFPLLESLGADLVMDNYSTTPTAAFKIKKLTNDNLTLVFDTIATPSTAASLAEALSTSQQRRYVSLLPVESPRKDVPSIFFLGHSASGENFDCEGKSYGASPEDH